ncbi:MAG: divergent polysaccharide deacetylase family protein [Candidatus Susulua stagnicola]|nr:divergent polysaccharide deacetylase family protein [Candidatus Susulua stagnicola]
MAKSLKVLLFLILIIVPIFFYRTLNRQSNINNKVLSFSSGEGNFRKPKIALIFDDLGESLKDLKSIYSLNIPLTISVIPNLRFSKNIAHIASRCGFSVFIHLPLEPASSQQYQTNKYKFITSDLSEREIILLLRQYLNSIRIAIGVNNHMGSLATQDRKLMSIILNELKKRNLIFIDSKTSLKSIAYEEARKIELISGYNQGFLDAVDNIEVMERRMEELIKLAKEKGKIIIIAHPRDSTLKFLKTQLPSIIKKIEFITIKDYFEL